MEQLGSVFHPVKVPLLSHQIIVVAVPIVVKETLVSSYLALAFGFVGLFCVHILKFLSMIPVLKDYLF